MEGDDNLYRATAEIEKPVNQVEVKALVQRQLLDWFQSFSNQTGLTFSRFNSDVIHNQGGEKARCLCVIIHIDLEGLEDAKR